MKKESIQYTLRNVPERVDARLRETAATYGVSLNTAAIEALARALGIEGEPVIHHDLDDLAGTWVADQECVRALAEMDQIDPEPVAMKIVIDTSRYRGFCEGIEDVVARFQLAERICLPLPVLAELRAGFACGTASERNEGVLNTFLNRPRVTCLAPDEQTTFHYARLYRQLREQGTPIPTNDLWIAALVQQHNLLLYSRDQHFDHLPQLARVR